MFTRPFHNGGSPNSFKEGYTGLVFKEINAQGKDRSQQSSRTPSQGRAQLFSVVLQGMHLTLLQWQQHSTGCWAGSLLSPPRFLHGSAGIHSSEFLCPWSEEGSSVSHVLVPHPADFPSQGHPADGADKGESTREPAHPTALLLLHNLPRVPLLVCLFLKLSSGIIQSE